MLTFTMTRKRAQELGLLTCATCGYPENNHFDWGTKPSARDESCSAYKEAAIRGVALDRDEM